jgi:ABC-type branched-subunit amino acid transport system ATPase component
MRAADGPVVLDLDDVKRHFGGIRAVDGVALRVKEGAVVALIGPNGAGKSTLFALMMGELAPTSGTIRLDGRDMKGLSPEDHSRLGVGRTFQTPRLFAGLTVAENAQIALLARAEHPSPKPQPHLQHSSSPRGDAQIEEVLGEVGLLDAREQPASSLSQGQRKRLELAMVLALRPRVLLLDEPTAGMGVDERAAIMALVMDAVRRRGLTLVFCEHDMETVFAHALRVVVMDRGRILTDGSPEEVRRDRRVQEIYLGTPEAS